MDDKFCLRPSVSTNTPVCTIREIERKQSIKIQKSQALSVKILFPHINIAKENICWISLSIFVGRALFESIPWKNVSGRNRIISI